MAWSGLTGTEIPSIRYLNERLKVAIRACQCGRAIALPKVRRVGMMTAAVTCECKLNYAFSVLTFIRGPKLYAVNPSLTVERMPYPTAYIPTSAPMKPTVMSYWANGRQVVVPHAQKAASEPWRRVR